MQTPFWVDLLDALHWEIKSTCDGMLDLREWLSVFQVECHDCHSLRRAIMLGVMVYL